jgi:hypothetical protein
MMQQWLPSGVVGLCLAGGVWAHGREQGKPQGAGGVTVLAPATAMVEGTVLSAANGQPLKKARVTLRRMFEGGPGAQSFPAGQGVEFPRQQGRNVPYVAVSDASGKFSIVDVQPGRYRLSVERQGYVRAEYGQRQPGRAGATLTLDAGQKLRELLFRLIEDGVITGRVTDEDGEPVVHGQVQVLRLSYQRGQKQFMTFGGAQTNDKGEYRVFGLTPGRYFLSATASVQFGGPGGTGNIRFAPGSPQGEEVYAPTYYPGTTEPQNATPISVGAGDEMTGMDLSIAPQRAFRVRGRVTPPPAADDRQTQRRGGLQVLLLRRGSAGSFGRAFSQQADVEQAQGTFEFRAVLPGSYYLMAATSDGRRWVTHREPLEVGRGDVEGLHVTIGPGMDLSGRLRIEGNVPLPANRVQVMVVPQEESNFGVPSSAAGPDGTFLLPGLSAETYFLAVQGIGPGAFLKTARMGGEDVLETGITLPSKAGGQLEIVMSVNGGRIEGSVLDSENLPAAAVTVVLVPPEKRRKNSTFYKTAVSDAQGRFTLQGIAPGDYKLFAWDDVDSGAWQDPEFLAPFEARGTKVAVTEGTTLAIEVKLIVNR